MFRTLPICTIWFHPRPCVAHAATLRIAAQPTPWRCDPYDGAAEPGARPQPFTAEMREASGTNAGKTGSALIHDVRQERSGPEGPLPSVQGNEPCSSVVVTARGERTC